jgi:hypothetical protein
VTDTGTVNATHNPGGALPSYPPDGPFGAKRAREAERQRKMAAGTW